MDHRCMAVSHGIRTTWQCPDDNPHPPHDWSDDKVAPERYRRHCEGV